VTTYFTRAEPSKNSKKQQQQQQHIQQPLPRAFLQLLARWYQTHSPVEILDIGLKIPPEKKKF